jgi:MerR family transcriptional regulator, light-induced transcriptional regulator
MLHTIRIASRRTGLSPHVIRIWERRYGVLASERTETNRRLYSDEDLDRLKLLGDLTKHGHQIGMIAHLDLERLREVMDRESPNGASNGNGNGHSNGNGHGNGHKPTPISVKEYLDKCSTALRDMDAAALRELLDRARVDLGYRAAIKNVVAPLIARVGEDWQSGDLRIAHEHLNTTVVREFLSTPPAGGHPAANAPELVVSTPAGGAHELGALLVAATARDLGWRVTYLGPSLPAEEITSVAKARSARAIAISLVYPLGDSEIRIELLRIRSLMPQAMVLILGGRAAESYKHSMSGIPGVRWCDQLEDMEHLLTTMA